MLTVPLDLLIAPSWDELTTLYQFVIAQLRFNDFEIAYVFSISSIILYHALIFFVLFSVVVLKCVLLNGGNQSRYNLGYNLSRSF